MASPTQDLKRDIEAGYPSVDPDELPLIQKFYKECPEGYSIDHIIPINGNPYGRPTRLNNLQYLRIDINFIKNAVLDLDWIASCDGPACKLDRFDWVMAKMRSAYIGCEDRRVNNEIAFTDNPFGFMSFIEELPHSSIENWDLYTIKRCSPSILITAFGAK